MSTVIGYRFVVRLSWIAVLIVALLALRGTGQAEERGAGRIINFQGDVQAGSPEGTVWAPVSVGQYLDAGHALRTGGDGWAALLLADETLVQINKNTTFVLKNIAVRAGWSARKEILPASATANQSTYQMDSGEIWIRNKNKGAVIDIKTPSITAGLRGTELNLKVQPDKTSILTVLEGVVRAWNDLGSEQVGPREQVIAPLGGPPRKVLLLTPEDAVQWTITVPSFVGPRDIPLVSDDRAFLTREITSLEARAAAPTVSNEDLVRLGQVQRDLGQPQEAAATFERVLAASPKDGAALTGLGWTWIDRGQPARAVDALARVKAPLAMTYLGLSVAYAEQDDLKRSRQAIEQGRARYPDFLPFATQEAFLDLNQRETIRARETLQKTTSANPDYPVGWSLLSLVALSQGDSKAALEAASNATRAAPESPDALVVQSYAYQASFELDRALETIQKALRINPSHVLALVNYAKIQFGRDYTDEAWEAIEKARSIAPEDADVLNVRGFLLLAGRKPEEAARSFQGAIRANPALGEPHLGLALVAMRQGNVPAATEEITAATLLEPRRSLFLSYWAKMLFQLKRFKEALDVLDLAAKLDPRDPTPELYKGIVLRDLNRPTEAIESLNKAIALNDNQGVYRSRFLLDRDLAVKAVDLSILYNQLGLSEWSTNKALTSIKEDFLNYSGHIFYANSLFAEEGLGRVASSEALLGRLLSPANENTFNTFNSYTPFFEQPSLSATATAGVGSFGTNGASLIPYGYLPQANLAFQAIGDYTQTSGWRHTNYEHTRGGAGAIKWDPTPNDSILLDGSYLYSRRGDELTRRFEYSSPRDPLDVAESELGRVELGYHHHFGPDNDLLFYFTRFDADGYIRSRDTLLTVLPNLAFLDIHDRSSFNQPYYLAQGQYLFKLGEDHQLFFGTLHYWGDNDLTEWNRLFLRLRGIGDFSLTGTDVRNGQDLKNLFQSYYIKDTWHIAEPLFLEAALYYDVMHQSNTFTGTTMEFHEFDPRFGLVWRPAPAHTFRVGAFRYILPFDANRIDPLEIAGIPIFRNTSNGAIAKEADLKYEYEWKSGFFSVNPFYLERDFSFKPQSEEEITLHGTVKGVRARVNQLLWQGMGLGLDYSFLKVKDDNDVRSNRLDHRVLAGLKYVHPSGFFGSLGETFRYEDMIDSGREDKTIWITDVGVGYEFPDKWGSINLAVLNVFDQHFDWVTDPFIFNGRVPEREIFFSLTLNYEQFGHHR
ncbi:MAG: tetratricopeptide repeat protein [Syntrophobacteraceae bacterium]